jgi:tRNA G26 N,N-dimethylase Trm1
MKPTYQISFRTKLPDVLSFQRLHDVLKKLNVKHWAYDFKDLLLSMRSELADFRSIQSALRSAGFRCDFIKMENLENNDNILAV